MKNLRLVLTVLFVLGLAFTIFNFTSLKRLVHSLSFFEENKIVENFRTLNEHFPVNQLKASKTPYRYEKDNAFSIPRSFLLNGKSVKSDYFLEGSKTTGLLVIQDDKIVVEDYFLGNKESTQNIAWSVSKSFISALFGIAIDEGFIKSINETVEVYVPELKGSAYEGVKIIDVLQMSSGVAFNEDYGNFFSDISRWGRSFALGYSQDEFAGTLKKGWKPGTYHHYVSIDTHVLGMILSRATKRSITDYMQEKLWEPLGMEYNAYWVTDNEGVELAMCGLNTCLRDFAKLGSLFLNNGLWNGKRIVSESWIKESTTAFAPHLVPGDNPNSAHELGYGYQWWLPSGNQGEYLAQGVYNQTIYINPTSKTVIVKLSANDKFNDADYIPSQWQATIAFYRAIVEKLRR